MLFCFLLVGLLFGETISETCPSKANVITLSDLQLAAYASKASYSDSVVKGTYIANKKFKVVKRIHKELVKGGEGIRVIFADRGNTRIIAFRGTDGQDQLMKEGLSVFKSPHKLTIAGKDVEVLKFFWEAYRLISFELRPYIWNPTKKYIITGHSLGGAMASIHALMATQDFKGSQWKNPKSCLITFGQPRTGDEAYAVLHDKLISTYRKIRAVYRMDLVARIPTFFRWHHHSRALYIGRERDGFFGKRSALADETWGEDEAITEDGETSVLDNEKRLFLGGILKTRNYWKICGTREQKVCTTTAMDTVPNTSDHDMDNYLSSILDPPSHIYTKSDTNKDSFEQALIETCKGQ